jgi:serine/threonine protein kinase
MADLESGFTIQTKGFKTVVVGRKLGEGGQGAVYEVDYNGQKKALKWYSGKRLEKPEKFYANLENNIKKGKPTKAFLWPEAITEKAGAAFGYIMDLRPDEYKDFTKFLLGKEKFASITAICNASLHIIDGFGELHRRGYSYQDLNDGNFFINPKTGDVLICDNDNVSEAGSDSGIAGKPRYMAPEIVRGDKTPNKYTDRFSLAVILFLLWTKNHPLEGKAAFPVCMDAAHDIKIYGENPVFIFDPDDNSNRPVQGLNKGAIANWPFLPPYLQEQFVKAFSKEIMKEPSKRIIELEWLRTLIRMRSEIYKCPCGEVYFADPANPNPCPACQKKNIFPFYFKFGKYNVPVHQRTKLYACHTEKDSEDFQTLTGEVAAKGGNLELKNVSGKNWTVTENGNASSVVPGGVLALKKGISVNFGNIQAEVI